MGVVAGEEIGKESVSEGVVGRVGSSGTWGTSLCDPNQHNLSLLLVQICDFN